MRDSLPISLLQYIELVLRFTYYVIDLSSENFIFTENEDGFSLRFVCELLALFFVCGVRENKFGDVDCWKILGVK